MTGIYPKWTGPDSEQLRESIFPSWIGGIVSEVVAAIQGIASARVLPVFAGVAMVASKIGVIARTVVVGADSREDTLGIDQIEGPSVRIATKEAGHD